MPRSTLARSVHFLESKAKKRQKEDHKQQCVIGLISFSFKSLCFGFACAWNGRGTLEWTVSSGVLGSNVRRTGQELFIIIIISISIMGCGASKDDTADLAGNFFGTDPVEASTLETAATPSRSRDKESASSKPKSKSKKSSSAATTSVSPTKKTKNKGGSSGNGNGNSGVTADPSVISPTKKKKAKVKSPKGSEGSNRASNNSHNSNNNTRRSGKKGTGKKTRKSDFIAPPSSESFVVNPAVASPAMDISPQLAAAVTPPPPPPPPHTPSEHTSSSHPSNPLSQQPQAQALQPQAPPQPPKGSSPSINTAYSETMHTHADKVPRELDDDDFSVAPSLAVAMRSVVRTSFDEIYERGPKVGRHDMSMCVCVCVCVWGRFPWFPWEGGSPVDVDFGVLTCSLRSSRSVLGIRGGVAGIRSLCRCLSRNASS